MRTREEIKLQISKNSIDFVQYLRREGFKLHKRTFARVSHSQITIGIVKEGTVDEVLFGADIEFYAENGFGQKPQINFRSSGSFDPTDQASYSKTMHAALFLENWDTFVRVCEIHCKCFRY